MALYQTATEKEILEKCIARCKKQIELMEDLERRKTVNPEDWKRDFEAPFLAVKLESPPAFYPLGEVKSESEESLGEKKFGGERHPQEMDIG
jgi:hypothetical protein